LFKFSFSRITCSCCCVIPLSSWLMIPLPLYLLLVPTYCLFTGNSHPVAYFWGLRAYRGGLRIFLSITQSHDFILNSITMPCVLFKSQVIIRLQGHLLGQRCTFAY
jgi:hypothetical protein